MFGGDHKPNLRDLHRSNQEAAYQVEEEDDIYYDDSTDVYAEYGDHYGVDYEDENVFYEEDIPEELEVANEEVDDAYMNYVDSRRKMKEIARGFFPVMAVPPSEFGQGGGWGGGKQRWKGRGKSKGKGKGKGSRKGAEKGGGLRRFSFQRRPTSGLTRDGAANLGTPSSDSARSTASGSTSGHGPRFKRYRLQDAGTKASRGHLHGRGGPQD